MTTRFRDTGQTIYDFCHEFLVHCPRCRNCASVVPKHTANKSYFAPRRLICKKCGSTQDWDNTGKVQSICFTHHLPPRDQNSIWIGSSYDWYFRLTLWLQTPCCGETLWAYNKQHLDFLENYVKVSLRENFPLEVLKDRPPTWRNNTLASRLPTWIKSAKNREEILKGINKLQAKCP